MSFKHKFSFEEKLKITTEYLNRKIGFRESCRVYSISQQSLKNWIRLYNTFGTYGLATGNTCTHYSAELKRMALDDYFNSRLTFPQILTKYKIRSSTQLQRWIKKYNSHEELKSSGTGGSTFMIKGRSTTYSERISIVEDCIGNEHNYAITAEKYKVSYQQVYMWVHKYEENGIEALQDRRGRTKPKEEMTELEKLRYENRLLKAEKQHQQMEIDFLKKLEEIERRRY